MMRILVTGGTGVIGRPTVDRLVERGHIVRLLSRQAERDAGLWAEGVEAHPGSVTDPGRVLHAADRCDVVLHIAGIVAEDPPELTFALVNVEGTRRLLEEARRAGVPRFVYVSSLGADRGRSDYHTSKREAEALVRQFDGDWLILRPGNVYGPGDEVISTLLEMVRTLPAIPTVGMGDQPFQPIFADDLAECLVAAVVRGTPSRVALELAGNEVTSTVGILEILSDITGKDPPRIPLPSMLVERGVEVAGALGVDLPISQDVLTMLAEENVLDPGTPNALTDVFGVQPTPLRVGLERLADALPERLPSEGVGPLYRHRYWADIRASQLDADALFRVVCQEFGALAPEGLLRVDVEGRGSTCLEPGATLTLEIPLRGTIQVRVAEVQDRAATSVTLAGHPLSGVIRFLVREPVSRDGPPGLRFEVRSYFRGSNFADGAVMATVGRPLQDATWRGMVEAVVRRSGGEATGGVHSDQHTLSAEEAAHVESWVDALVLRQQQRDPAHP
jgi:nucleoside-diphosphate-sugar epimerase